MITNALRHFDRCVFDFRPAERLWAWRCHLRGDPLTFKELNQTQVNSAGDGIPNLYTHGMTTLDMTASFAPFHNTRLRFAAGNLLDRPAQEFVGPIEMRRWTTGRTYSVAFTVGS